MEYIKTFEKFNEEDVTRSNISKMKNLAPDGYDFTKKELTETATKKLNAYWNQVLNHKELREETKDKRTESDWEWIRNYSLGQQKCLSYLIDNKFVKKIKK